MASVLLEHPAEHVALVRIDRPEALNVLNIAARRLLPEIFQGLSEGMRAFIEKRKPNFAGN